MIKTILSYIQVIHAGIILYLTFELYQYPKPYFNLHLSIAEILLTAVDVFIIRRSLDIVPLLISGSLFSTLIVDSPIQIYWVPMLFLAKIIYVNDILADSKRLLFSGDNCSFCQLGGIIYNFVRFTLVEYMFLGIVIMIYKAVVLHFDKSVHDLPENHSLFYQMMVTATTIGYGDVCPKSRIQMNFFTCAIPFIIGSFIIYVNHVNPLWDDLVSFLNDHSLQSSPSLINVQSMTQSEKDSLNEFAILSTEKKREEENFKLAYFNDWISLAAINFEKQAELIHTIVEATISKEEKLAIVSKVRQQHFPKDWIILDSNDVSQDLFMIAEGEIDINGETKSTGFVFNQKGFFCQATSVDKVVAKSFISVWAVSLSELEELTISCPSIQQKINANIRAYSE